MDNNTSKNKYYSTLTKHWDYVAKSNYFGFNNYYHRYLERVYRYFIPPGLRVLEIGCGKGDLLASVNPEVGIGIDLSGEMIQQGKEKYPHLQFYHGLGEEVMLDGIFDVVIFSDILNSAWDIQELFGHVQQYCDNSTRIIINVYSRLWQPILNIARKFGLAAPMLPHSWLTVEDLRNLLYLTNFDVIETSSEILIPVNIPIISHIVNRYLARLFPTASYFSCCHLTN